MGVGSGARTFTLAFLYRDAFRAELALCARHASRFLVSCAAVIRGALRDDPNNGCAVEQALLKCCSLVVTLSLDLFAGRGKDKVNLWQFFFEAL